MESNLKIYIVPVANELQPKNTQIIYPAHNKDYGVEQDFHKFILSNPQLVISNPKKADFHYLPAYWSRWHLNHQYGSTDMTKLNQLVNNAVIDSQKTFSICAYDNGPKINNKLITFFNASDGDIPLLSQPLFKPIFPTTKKYVGSFIGRTDTHPIRKKLAKKLSETDDFFILDTNQLSSKDYAKILLQSYFVIAPRGKGGSSFRFYEAMQLARVPVMISDEDNRPFKQFINWEECSLFFNDPSAIHQTLRSINPEKRIKMGKTAYAVWKNKLRYGKWCQFVIKELEQKK